VTKNKQKERERMNHGELERQKGISVVREGKGSAAKEQAEKGRQREKRAEREHNQIESRS
jgi:hypothetical protein